MSRFVKSFLTEDQCDALLDVLRPLRDYKSGGRWRTAMADDPDVALLGSKTKSSARKWNPLVRELRDHLQAFLGVELNFVLVNHYDSGKDFINYHSDNLRNSVHGTVVSISLGDGRTFRTRHKMTGEENDVLLENGDLFVFDEEWNRVHWHAIPKEKNRTYRCNLTFRCVSPTVVRGPPSKLFGVSRQEFLDICETHGIIFVTPDELKEGDAALKRWGNAGNLTIIDQENIHLFKKGREGKKVFGMSDVFFRCPKKTLRRFQQIVCPMLMWYYPRGSLFTPTMVTHYQIAGMLQASGLRCGYEILRAEVLENPIPVSANGASSIMKCVHGDMDGLKLHYPFSRYLFGGIGKYKHYPCKSVETRGHIRFDISNRTMAIVETQGNTSYGRKHIKAAGASVIGVVTFGDRILYGVPEHFAADAHRHLVDVESVPDCVYNSELCAWVKVL